MNCILPGLNLKVFAKALQALSKIGDELFLEAKHDKLSLVTLNLNRTICARCYFFDCFFSSYNIKNTDTNTQDDNVHCKIHMKAILPLFKGQNIEKKIELLRIEFENGDDIIVFKMKFKQDDFLMVHKVRLMDPETLTIQIDVESGSNNLCASSVFYNELLNTFSNTDDEITLEISKKNIVARNYSVGAPVRPKHVRSQVTLNPSEFNIYTIKNETTVSFSLKPLRTAINFADNSINIGFNFEIGGKPLSIIMRSSIFEMNMLVATINPYNDNNTTINACSIPTKITQVENIQNLTSDDRDALLNENWDEFDCDMDTNSSKSSKVLTKSNKNNEKRPKDFREALEKISGKKIENVPKNSKKSFEFNVNSKENDVIPVSPESPKTKRMKMLFKRCFEPTFNADMLGEVLVPDSDSD